MCGPTYEALSETRSSNFRRERKEDRREGRREGGREVRKLIE
jgi:hypothetical protein